MASEIYVPKSVDEVSAMWLADIRNEAISRGLSEDPPVHEGTDLWMRSRATAAIAMLQFGNVSVRGEDIDPRTATGPGLERWRIALGLPEVVASGSSGRIKLTVTGTSTVPDGTELVLPSGKRLQVVGNWVGVVNGSEIAVRSIDTGEDTRAAPNTLARFVSAPINVASEARVSVHLPLTGGTDSESDGRKRIRVLNALANRPAGGNWSDKVDKILGQFLQVQDVYIYPALGGPASERIVPVKGFYRDQYDFSRALTVDAVDQIRDFIHGLFPSPDEIVVSAAAEHPTDVTIKVDIPASALVGGAGTGWLDAPPWPTLEPGDGGRVQVLAVANPSSIVVAPRAATPTLNITRIAWWSPSTQRFITRLITARSVTFPAGDWQLTLDAPLIDEAGVTVAVGDFISPAAVNLDGYGETFVDIMEELGPGEATNDANRLPRSLRHPYVADGRKRSPALKVSQLELFSQRHAEIVDYEFGYRSTTTAPLPVDVAHAPLVLVPRHFGVYPL